METFAEKLIKARAAQGLTQAELARKAQISVRTLQGYEQGARCPRAKGLYSLAQVLKISTTYLTVPECEDPKQDIEKDKFFIAVRESFGKIGEEDIKELLEMNTALFAGGDVSQDQKDAFFEAVTKAYFKCKEEARKKFGTKDE